MEYFKRMLITCLLIGFIHIALTKPAENDLEDPELYEDLQGDDDYMYDDDDDDNKSEIPPSNLEENKNLLNDPPYFQLSNMTIEGNSGDDIILPCEVTNFQINNVAMWFNGSQLITTGKVKIGQNDRITLLQNNAIKISNVNDFDSNDYYCRILPQDIKFHIQLNVMNGPRVEIFSSNRLVTNKQLLYRQGDKAEFQCKAFGIDDVELKWSLDGMRADNIVTKIENGKVLIDSIDAEHAGKYNCLGDIKGSLKPLPMATVSVQVQYLPKVSTHRHYVNTAAGDKAEMHCDYKADPIAIVEWKRNGVILQSYSEKYTIVHSQHNKRNRSMLVVKNVDENDLGEYTCDVKNKIGSSHINVHLIFEPETPQFEKIEINGSKVSIYWLVRSIQPLAEAVLDYRLNLKGKHWQTESMISSQKHPEHNDIWKLRHDIVVTEGLWHARVKTKNTVNWSKFSTQHDFLVAFDSNPAIDENSIPKDVIKAGIGGGSGASSISIISSTILFGCVLAKIVIPSIESLM